MSTSTFLDIMNQINKNDLSDITQKDMLYALVLVTNEQNQKIDLTNSSLKDMDNSIQTLSKNLTEHSARIEDLEKKNVIQDTQVTLVLKLSAYIGALLGTIATILSIFTILNDKL